MFELTKTGLWFLGAGILYMLFAGRWLLPQREVTTELTDAYDMGDYLSEIRVLPEAEDVDKSIATSRLIKDHDIAIINITREDGKITYPLPYTRLRAHDLLKIRCSMDKLQALREVKGIEVKAEKDIRDSDLQSGEMKFYEVLIPPNSRLAGRSLYSVNFRIVYQASVLAIRSRNEILHEKIGHSTLHAGDVLLVLGSEKQMQKVTKGEDLLLLSETEAQQFSFRKMIIVMLIAVAVVVAAAAGSTSIVISATIGALLMVLTRSISPEEAYNAIEWKVIFMLAGVLSMGTALEKTGGAAFIAQGIEGIFSTYGNHVMLSVLFLITFLATNVMSNNATAALLAPIAISIAQSMGVSERPFLMAVTFAASLSFMTPMGYQTNTMIYAPGNYRFKDYLIVGTPLNLLLWLLASILIPMHFPF
jgi:di/tricarboxylate transporter